MLNQEGSIDGAKTVTLSAECIYYNQVDETFICFVLPVESEFQMHRSLSYLNSIHDNSIIHLGQDPKMKRNFS